jgi:hypothetical protein
MEPEADYPAAHSMDTTWFAVDRDGHVAWFYSGEDGAVPRAAASDAEGDALRTLLEGLPANLPGLDLMTWLGEGEGSEERHVDWATHRPKGWDWHLLFLESLDPIEGQLDEEESQCLSVPAPVGFAVLIQGLPKALAKRLHKAGACLGCFGPIDYDELPGHLGLFTYATEGGPWGASPYGRVRAPQTPLRVEDLDAELREALSGMRFDGLCFAETERLQPVDHASCEAWGDVYVDLDGKTLRPIPGREGRYRQFYEEMSRRPEFQSGEYRLEPPPAG